MEEVFNDNEQTKYQYVYSLGLYCTSRWKDTQGVFPMIIARIRSWVEAESPDSALCSVPPLLLIERHWLLELSIYSTTFGGSLYLRHILKLLQAFDRMNGLHTLTDTSNISQESAGCPKVEQMRRCQHYAAGIYFQEKVEKVEKSRKKSKNRENRSFPGKVEKSSKKVGFFGTFEFNSGPRYPYFRGRV